jgi:ADP-ribosylation factor-like protein 3
MWDIGGQKAIRPYWKNYYDRTNGIVFVVDSSDEERL